jgi:hypothetical protein
MLRNLFILNLFIAFIVGTISQNGYIAKVGFSTSLNGGMFSKGAKLIVGGLIMKAVSSNSPRITKFATDKTLKYLKKNPQHIDKAITFTKKYTKSKSPYVQKKGQQLIVAITKIKNWGKARNQTYSKSTHGGSHRDMQKPKGDGRDSHHIPDRHADPRIHPNDGMAVKMSPKDHKYTSSYGSSRSSKLYRKESKDMILKERKEMP